MVRAKFRCVEKVVRHSQSAFGSGGVADSEEVKLSAVMGEENKPWSKWTPSGEIRMSITNPEAVAQFEVGKDYFVDFTPCESAAGQAEQRQPEPKS